MTESFQRSVLKRLAIDATSPVHALADEHDFEVQALWAWLAKVPSVPSGDRDVYSGHRDVYAGIFMQAVMVAAAEFRTYRATVRATLKKDVREFFGGDDLRSSPSRALRLLARSQRSGAQTDFLRVLAAKLLDVGFDFDAPGIQTNVMRVARAVLGDDGIGLTPNTVSAVWAEARADLLSYPQGR